MVSLPARLTIGTAAAELQRLVPQVAAQGQGPVALDGSTLEQFDSSAIAVMLELRRQVLRHGGQLSVTRLPPRLSDLMALYGVGELLPG
ncbi:MAG: STAS domain-containing protein [Burkholderiales bacterium]|nr:MAG: STAS domain-containing protein [Burkholderiales bacterium]